MAISESELILVGLGENGDRQKTRILKLHNDLRREMAVPQMLSWSDDLAASATERAKEIALTGGVCDERSGENICSLFSEVKDEGQRWDRVFEDCARGVGARGPFGTAPKGRPYHPTIQVLWKATTQIGASFVLAPVREMEGRHYVQVYVTHYAPPASSDPSEREANLPPQLRG